MTQLSTMKRIAIIVLLGGFALGMSSCEKCATCTIKDADGTIRTSEDVCQKRKAYNHTIEQYEERGWTCTKN